MGDELKDVMHFSFRGGNSLHDDYCQVKGPEVIHAAY